MNRRRRDPAPTCAQVNEDQEIQVHEPADRPHLLRREIALPKLIGVDLEKLIPSPLSSLGTGIETMLLQNVLDRLTRDLVDSQPPKLSQDPGIAPRVLSRQFHDKGPDVVRRPRPTWLPDRDLLGRILSGGVSNSSQE